MFWFLVSTFVVILGFVLVNRLNYWNTNGVPQVSSGRILLNIVLMFFPYQGIVENFDELYNSFPNKRCFGTYQIFKPVLFLRDPDLIKQITIKDFDHFTDHQQILPDDGHEIWRLNLFALKGDIWRDMRATLSPSFTSNKLKIIFGLVADCGKQFVDYFDEKSDSLTVVEIKNVFTRFTNDVIATTAFGVSCNSLKDQNNVFYEMGKQLADFDNFKSLFRMILLFTLPRKLVSLLSLSFIDIDAANFFSKLIDENIKNRETHGIVRPDMMHLLLEAKKNRLNQENINEETPIENNNKKDQSNSTNPKRLLTNEDIMAQAFIFFLAGFESISSVMSFMAYEVAVNVDVRQRLQEEIDEIYDQCDGKLTYDYLTKMKYMDMVVSETLRLYPVTFSIDRVCNKPYTIKEDDGTNSVQLNKGDLVFIPILSIHRDSKYYPDPMKFCPERFSEENKHNIDLRTYLPFGSGPRHCIANRFALMEIKMLFFYILQKFDIIPVDKTVIPLKLAKSKIKLVSEGGIWLGLKKRKN